jgi:glycosyltransferase involved in cell wall biosynthesis
MSVSVCIPVRNEGDLLKDVLSNLITTAETEDFEIVLFNDGSTDSNARFKPLEIKTEFRNLRITNSPIQYGVGYAFDRAVEQASNEIIVLMGADVMTDFGWLKSVKNAVETHPDSIGCSACVGISPENMDMHREGRKIRYGADMLIQVSMEDLPKNTQEKLIAHKRNSYTNLFKAKWRWGRDSEEPYEIPCLLGAFYFTSKSFYQKIHGWDTEEHRKFQGHIFWGSLEPMLSLKAYLYGGSCLVFPDIETAHIFGRLTKRTAKSHRALRPSYSWWNALWIAYTMCDDKLRDYLINWCDSELALNRAKTYVRKNMESLLKVREMNEREFTKDVTWYMERFKIDLK